MQEELKKLSEEEVRSVFNSFDANGNGQLEQAELLKAVNELGAKMSNYQLKSIVKKLDTDKDGKISFDEFYQWWYHGKQNGLEDLVFLKFKSQKYFNKAQKKLNKIGQLVGNATETQEHSISVNVGEDAPAKSFLGLRGFVGQEAADLSKELTQDLSDIQHDTPAILIKFQVKNAAEAKDAFEEMVEQILTLAESMFPEYAELYLETVKINVSVFESDYIQIGITGQHQLVSEIVNEYIQLVEEYVPVEFMSTLNINLSLGLDLNSLTQNLQKQFSDLISEAGLNLTVDAKINQSLLEKTQNEILQKLEKKSENLGSSLKMVQMILPLFFIAGSRVNLNFKTFEKVVQEMGLPIPEEVSNLEQGLGLLKEMTGDDPKEMMEEIPILEEILELFKTHCESDVTITVQAPKIALQVYGVTKGISKAVDLFLEGQQ